MSSNRTRNLTLKQTEIVREFVAAYDISPDHISFDGEDSTPIFHHEALATVAGRLLDFSSLSVSPARIEETYAMAEATLTLESGRTVTNFGYCSQGEILPGDKKVEDIATALDVSRVRALRAALRMIGFDPVRAHNARGSSGSLAVQEGKEATRLDADPRTKELKHIHALATELAWIRGADKTEYYRQLGIYFPFVDSASDLSDEQRKQFIAILNGLFRARHAAMLKQEDERARSQHADIASKDERFV